MSRRPIVRRDVEIEIADLSGEGYGRNRLEAREIRMRNALPGERVQGLVKKRRRRVDYGDALVVANPSPARAPVVCTAAGRCGGCTFQHVQASFELSWKEQQLSEALHRHGVVPERWMPPVSGPQHGYRHKARLGVRRLGEQAFVGFREAFSGRVVDMEDCSILEPRLARLIVPLRDLIRQLTIGAQIPQFEVAAGDRQVALVIRHLQPITDGDQHLITRFAAAHRLEVFLQPAGPESVVWCAGRGEGLGYANADFGLHFAFEPLDFVQVNPHINRQLVRAAALALRDCERVVDLFCGLGNFSLALASTGMSVMGLELSGMAVERATYNARRNGLADRAEFRSADLYGPAGKDSGLPEGYQGLLLDPPRLGAGPRLTDWLHDHLRTVVYVSCNPVSFAADAEVLAGAGYRLQQVGIYDMFPQTTHVETLGVFRRH